MLFVIKNLARRPLRTFFGVLGIGVGIAAVVALISLARGFEKELDDLLTRLRGDILIKEADRVTPESSRIPERVVAEIGRLEGVAGVSGYVFQMLFFGEFRIPLYGYEPTQPILRKVHVEEGRRIAPGGLDEVMVGVEAARHLGVRVGREICVPPSNPEGHRLRVVGLFSTGSRYQDIGCIIHLRTAQLFARMPGHVTMLAVDVVDEDRAAAVRDAIQKRYPGLEVLLARDFTRNLEDYQLVAKFAWAVSFIAVVIGAIGVLNTMLMSVLERTREIGMLLALGWSRWRVLAMILAEGALVSVAGGIVGIGLGVLLVDLVSEVVEELPIVAGHDLELFAQAVGLALALGTLGSLLPAYKASRLSPVEALRHE